MSVTRTRERILDAATRALAHHGLSRLSLEDVAREAGLSRQTVYRYFGSRDELLRAAILREEDGFLLRVTAAAGQHADLRPAVEAAVREALSAARDHALLDRLLDVEPEALLPFLTTGRGPVLTAARPAIEALLEERAPHLTAIELGRIADAVTRLVISYAINPSPDPVDEVAAGLADLLVHGIKNGEEAP